MENVVVVIIVLGVISGYDDAVTVLRIVLYDFFVGGLIVVIQTSELGVAPCGCEQQHPSDSPLA